MSRKFLTPILLPADPAVAMEAATNQYVDDQAGGGSLLIDSPDADYNTLTTPGQYLVRYGIATPPVNGPPGGNWEYDATVVQVWGTGTITNDTPLWQTAYPNSSPGPGQNMWQRTYNGTTWTAWIPFIQHNTIQGPDLNGMVQSGVFLAGSTAPNAPQAAQGVCVVDVVGQGYNHVVQTWTNASGATQYRRSRNASGTWSSWVLLSPGPTAWTNFTLSSGLVPYGAPFATPSYRLNGDVVECRGLVKNPTASAIAAGSAIATFPAGFRPPATVRFACNGSPVNANTDGYMAANLTSAGALTTVFAIPASNGFLFLDTVRFSVTA